MNTTARADGHQGIVILLCLFTVGLGLGALETEAAAPEGKGKDNATAQAAKSKSQGKAVGRPENAQGRQAGQRGADSSTAARARQGGSGGGTTVTRQHPQQARNSRNGADRSSGVGRDETRGRPQQAQRPQTVQGQGIRGREAAQAHVQELHQALNHLERARWSYNPHDTRGQGNMGKVDMQDPYGFARDDRMEETGNRGRPIRESEAEESLNLAELVTAEFIDPAIGHLLDTIAWYEYYIELYAERYPWYADYLSSIITILQGQLADHIANPPDTFDAVLIYGDLVEYSLTFEAFEGLDTTTLQVTTQLVSTETVSLTGWAPDETGTWGSFSTTYETGEVLAEQTQDLVLSEDGTFTLSLDPSAELLNGGFFNGSQSVTTDVVVTITDTVSGDSFTMTLDQQIRLVDPYGIVYDKAMGTPIAGAVVTVHHADGSVVVLDKSANPNVSNPQMTDATGRYSCKLAIGKYYLTVKAPGYEEYQSALFSEQGHIVREDVGMTALGVTAPLPAASKPLSSPVAHEAAAGFVVPLPGAGVGSSSLLAR